MELSVGTNRPRRLFGARAIQEVYLARKAPSAGRLNGPKGLIPIERAEGRRADRTWTGGSLGLARLGPIARRPQRDWG